jgi:STE24 endopeptidase
VVVPPPAPAYDVRASAPQKSPAPVFEFDVHIRLRIGPSRAVTAWFVGTMLSSGVARADATVAVPVASAGALAEMRNGDILWAAAQLLALAIPVFFLVTGLGARLRRICSRIVGGRWFWTVATFACAYLFLAAVIALPLDYYRDYVRPHAFGWSHQTLPEWMKDEGVQIAVRLIAASLFIWIPYLLIVRSPRRWWLYGALALIPVAFLALVVLPVWVAPLTTRYKPLDDAQLGTRIEALAKRCGVSRIPVFIGGNDTTVVGLGPTNRIVLQSDIATAETPDQIEFTIGHELKHYVLGDNWKALVIIASLLLVGFWLADRLGRAAIRLWSRRFGFSELADPASLPLMAVIFTAFWLCTLPLFNLFARHIEHEADRFGLELTHKNYATAIMFAQEAQAGRAPEWDTFFLIFRATHPSVAERIRFANAYKPWERGIPPVYGKVCRPE